MFFRSGRFASEIVAGAGSIGNGGEAQSFITDEQPRATSEAALAKLKSVTRPDGTVTAGNASGINDGAAAMIIATLDEAKCQGLTPRAKILGYAVAGVEPRFIGVGHIPAISRLLDRTGLQIADFDLIEINEIGRASCRERVCQSV